MNAATSKRFTEGIAKLDNKYAHEIADQDTQIEDQSRHMVHNVCSTLDTRITDESASLEEKT